MNNIELDKKMRVIARTLVYEKGFICSVDMLLRLGYLSKENYEAWRFGRIPFLEKVCDANFNKLTFINKAIRKFAVEFGLEGSKTGYYKYGKGARIELTFSNSRNSIIEDHYSTHWVDKKRIAELKESKAGTNSQLPKVVN